MKEKINLLVVHDRLPFQAWFNIPSQEGIPTVADFADPEVGKNWLHFMQHLHPTADDFGLLEVVGNEFHILLATPHVFSRLAGEDEE